MLVGQALLSLILTLWNIGILHHKQAKLPKHLQLQCIALDFNLIK